MIGFWMFLYACYLIAPINQTPSPSFTGVVFVVSQIFIFCIGAVLATGGLGERLPVKPFPLKICASSLNVSKQINIFSLIGIIGALLSLFDKILRLDSVNLHEIAVLRSERAHNLLNATPASISVLSAIGFLTYPAGFLALVLTLVFYESLSRAPRFLSVFYFVSIIFLNLASGGRSMIFVAILFLGIASYIRGCRGLNAIPKSHQVRIFLLLVLVGFISYSTLIWQIRSESSNLSVSAFLNHAEVKWGVTPTENLTSLALLLQQPSLTQSVLSSIFYFTQSISIIENILGMSEVPLMLGTYHIDLFAAAVRVFCDNQDGLAQGYAALLKNNVYGFFSSAWGALYIDFGFFGSYIATFFWGLFAGLAHRHARRNIYSDGFILYVFWMYSILISFVSPPFGFSNSAVTFFWFVVYKLSIFSTKTAGLTRKV